jgi:uncharacterized membrane protein YhaH (DUF805 family)
VADGGGGGEAAARSRQIRTVGDQHHDDNQRRHKAPNAPLPDLRQHRPVPRQQHPRFTLAGSNLLNLQTAAFIIVCLLWPTAAVVVKRLRPTPHCQTCGSIAQFPASSIHARIISSAHSPDLPLFTLAGSNLLNLQTAAFIIVCLLWPTAAVVVKRQWQSRSRNRGGQCAL